MSINLLKISNFGLFSNVHKNRCENEYSHYEILGVLQSKIKYTDRPIAKFAFPCTDELYFTFALEGVEPHVGKRYAIYKFTLLRRKESL
jgi:hypothetical protein